MEQLCFYGNLNRPYSVTTRDDLLRDIDGSQELLGLRTALMATAASDEACDFASAVECFVSPRHYNEEI